MDAPFALCSNLINSLRKEVGSFDRGKAKIRCKMSTPIQGAFWMIVTSLCFWGIGRALPAALLTPLAEDNLDKDRFIYFVAAISATKVAGPALGFILHGLTQRWYYTLQGFLLTLLFYNVEL
ncbi:unnamed protein product [Anisakis simplex]|uniref:MFS_1_like domain-containing protein n=1 Tax=Anisakis simplex TaxID=6269 RepID=A0A0M3KJ87_ANISI|nr:unnamed protein product [Anisakis simplex]